MTPRGETRGRYYVAADPVRAIHEDVRQTRPAKGEYDPFALAQQSLQLTLEEGAKTV